MAGVLETVGARTVTPSVGRPCQTCGIAHTEHPVHGWRADNGHGMHGYLQGTTNTVAPNRPGWRGSLFGALMSCEACGAVCDPAHRDLVAIHELVCHGTAT